MQREHPLVGPRRFRAGAPVRRVSGVQGHARKRGNGQDEADRRRDPKRRKRLSQTAVYRRGAALYRHVYPPSRFGASGLYHDLRSICFHHRRLLLRPFRLYRHEDRHQRQCPLRQCGVPVAEFRAARSLQQRRCHGLGRRRPRPSGHQYLVFPARCGAARVGG